MQNNKRVALRRFYRCTSLTTQHYYATRVPVVAPSVHSVHYLLFIWTIINGFRKKRILKTRTGNTLHYCSGCLGDAKLELHTDREMHRRRDKMLHLLLDTKDTRLSTLLGIINDASLVYLKLNQNQKRNYCREFFFFFLKCEK